MPGSTSKGYLRFLGGGGLADAVKGEGYRVWGSSLRFQGLGLSDRGG